MGQGDHQQELEQVLSSDFLADIGEVETAELRRRRQRAELVENRVSYARRLLQGRIDLVRAEILRRGDNAELGEVLAGLPAVLADQGGGPVSPANVRPPRELTPPDLDDDPLHDRVVNLPSVGTDELREFAESLAQRESELSATRRQLFDVIDRLQVELMARYRSGAASISELLAE